jgi:tetratricopeptide (TPR) repeat protein
MTDQLITSLSQNHDLRVISYTSVLGYKNTKKLAPEIARELGVDALVEGSVQRTGGRVRVNAQLIYAPQDAHLWAHSYASDLQDALTMQSELAGAIAGQVNARLTPAFQARLRVPHPVNLKALESYLQGNAYLAKVGKRSSVGDAQMAIEFFQNAIREDPTFAAAYLKICQVYEVQSVLFSKAERWPKEKAAAEKALALDPNLAGAHLELGLVKMSYDFDLAGAGAEFERAIELDPNSANAHESYGDYLESINRLDEGLREHQLAQSLDPGADHMSNSLYRHRQYDQAIELLKKRVETQLDDGAAHYGLSHNYAQKGMQKDFVYEFQKTAVWYGYDDVAKAVGRVYALHGYRAAQQEVARQLELYYARGELDRPVQIAIAYCRMGEKEQALRWMEQGFKDRDADLVMLYPEPEVDFLRSDPRFKDLMRRVGVSTQ